ncbi:hypothetical protein ACMAUO_12790 [Gluconacetobacter sp. Hr-1-5]|uniref:hypothetical protein n=1 Tax=Gluconacetobacter sp. Hr-1-5 TaxID=3395370 RepID=UPI003B519956
MLSDTVWNDAYTRAKAVCECLGVDIVDPLLQDLSKREDPYWQLPMGIASSDRLGMGEPENEEEGQIVLVLMVPRGSLSTPDALEHCGAMSAAFRAPVGETPQPWAPGLFYSRQDFVPPDLDSPGNWYALTLMVSYRYQSALVQNP